jgi:hypothetical protein
MITLPFRPALGPIVVVVTEDEAAIRTLADEVLAEAGFTVVEAAHAPTMHSLSWNLGR